MDDPHDRKDYPEPLHEGANPIPQNKVKYCTQEKKLGLVFSLLELGKTRIETSGNESCKLCTDYKTKWAGLKVLLVL